MTVKAIDAWKTNAEMIADVAKLGYLDGTVIDLTYGLGRFWTVFRPEVLITNDLDPERPADHHLDFTSTYACLQLGTWPDAVVFDAPYAFKGTSSGKAVDTDYGIDRYRTPDEVDQLRYDGIRTAETLLKPGGYLLVKCQDQIVSGKPRWQTYDTVDFCRTSTRLTLVEDFKFLSYRPQPAGRRQVHARRNYSSLLIFRKAQK